MQSAGRARRICRSSAIILVVALLGWIGLPRIELAESAGSPPGYARIWIYRYDEPYVSEATPYILFNNRIVAISRPGTAFYRDVRPGDYDVTVDPSGQDINQFARVVLAAGRQIYIQIQVSKLWNCGSSAIPSCRDTFYTRVQPPQIGAAAIASLQLLDF